MKYGFKDIVIDSRTGLNPRKNFVLGNGENNYITIKDIYNGQINITDKTDKVDDEAIQIIKKRSRIKVGDILFVSIGRIGETAIVEAKDDTWDVNESVFVFTINREIITPEYFCTLFQSDAVQKYLAGNSSGSTFKSIKMNQLERMEFDLPPLEIQESITEKLSKVKAICTKRSSELTYLDDLIKARFVEMFGDPETNPKGWKKAQLKDHATVLVGYPFPSEGYTAEGVDIVGGYNLMQGYIQWEDSKHWQSYEGFEQYLLKDNDIVMAMDRPWVNGGFKIARVDGTHLPALLIQRTACIRRIDVDQAFLYYLLDSNRFAEHCNIIGSLVPHISNKDINSFEIILPPKAEQVRFAAFGAQIDKSKSVIQKSLDETQLLFDSLMQKYFG